MPFGFYRDSGLTVPVTSNLRHYSTQGDQVIYLGNPVTGFQLQDSASPGVADMFILITDSNGATGLAATDVSIAASSGGLSTATPGDPLNIGTVVTSGVSNAVPVYIRFGDLSAEAVGDYTDLGLSIESTIESSV